MCVFLFFMWLVGILVAHAAGRNDEPEQEVEQEEEQAPEPAQVPHAQEDQEQPQVEEPAAVENAEHQQELREELIGYLTARLGLRS